MSSIFSCFHHSYCVHFINVQWKPFNGLINEWWDCQGPRILPFEPGKIHVFLPCINQYRADWLKLCDERLQKIHSNKLNLVHSLHLLPRQQHNFFRDTKIRTREEQNEELTPKKLKRSATEIKEVSLKDFEKERMTLICILAIILPSYALQNQEMPEVEMFVRHTIGGYHLKTF